MASGFNLNALSGFTTNVASIQTNLSVTSNDGVFTVTGGSNPIPQGHPSLMLSAGSQVSINAFVFGSSIVSANVVSAGKADLLPLTTGTGFGHVVGWNNDGILVQGVSTDGAAVFTFVGEQGTLTSFNQQLQGADATFNTNPDDVPAGFAVCFAAGTSIGTPAGNVAVEDLKVGGEVLTASGKTRQVVWVGEMLSRPAKHPRPHEVNPVRMKAGAFGDGLPVRDLRVSPGHALYIDGVLIRAASLVNGATILQEDVESIRYFHVELESHDVLLAEGLPCESYLDDGNRSGFNNSDEAILLYGRIDPTGWDNACAPWIDAGAQLEAVRNRLHARAEAMGFEVSNESDLHLLVDGVRLEPVHTNGNRFWFQIPASNSVQLGSNADVLTHVVPDANDHRRLGVALGELRVNGAVVALNDAAVFGSGFYGVETHNERAWRWMDGAATLGLALTESALVELTLHAIAPAWKRPKPVLRLVHKAN